MKCLLGASLVSLVWSASSYVRVAHTDVWYGGMGPLESYTFPQMGGQHGEQVYSASQTLNNSFLGVWDTNGSGLVFGVNSSTSTAVGSMSGFGDFAVSKGPGKPATAFISSTSASNGLFVQLPSGEFVEIATTQTVFAPAGGAPFETLGDPSVEISKDLSTIYVAFYGTTGSYLEEWRGIILATLPVNGGTVSLNLVVSNSMTMPDSGARFHGLSGPKVTSEGKVIFFGNGYSASEMVMNQFSNPVMNDRHVSGSLSVVANDLSTVPGGTSSERFVSFTDPGVGLDGTVVFVGRGSETMYAIFKETSSGLNIVASNQMEVPGYSGCKFAWFPQVPSVDADGNVVFFGQGNDGVAGVFASKRSGGFSSLLSNADKVDGYDTISIGYGQNAVSGGKAAVYLVLSDENVTNGIWVFDVLPSEDVVLV